MDVAFLYRFLGVGAALFCAYELHSGFTGKGMLVRPTPREYSERRHWYRRVTAEEAPVRYWLVFLGNVIGVGFGIALVTGLIG